MKPAIQTVHVYFSDDRIMQIVRDPYTKPFSRRHCFCNDECRACTLNSVKIDSEADGRKEGQEPITPILPSPPNP